MKKNVYFDNSATTKLHPKVLEAMLPYFKDEFGNPSSVHSFGRKAKVAVEESREIIAGFLNCDASEIYFTSSGTESNNFVIQGLAKTGYLESGRNLILSTATEHKSVLDTLKHLQSENFRTKLMEVDESGKLTSKILEKYLTGLDSELLLISVIDTNNETGIKNDIDELVKITRGRNIYFHTDAVQKFGKEKIDLQKAGVDLLTASAHKINGPKGTGIAYIRAGTPMMPLIYGGSQERNRRGGTENVAGIVGLAEAVKIASSNMQNNFEYVKSLREYFKKELGLLDDKCIRINESGNNSPYILSLTLIPDCYKIDSESILMFMDINGIAVSNGAACTSGTVKASHVIQAMGKSKKYAEGTIRFSFSAENTLEDINYALEILTKLTRQIKK